MNWQKKHGEVISDFLSHLNRHTDQYILKGGTALAQCYGLDRFSEDIDLDATKQDLTPIVEQFCKNNGYTFRTKKDTETTQRYMIEYAHDHKPLKIEASYRKREILSESITKINGIAVYDINMLCNQKCAAYAGRDKIRDLYDMTFIVNNYYGELTSATKTMAQSTIEHKGVEQFDYLTQTQEDLLINKDKLETNFLNMWDRLDLMTPTAKEIINASNTR